MQQVQALPPVGIPLHINNRYRQPGQNAFNFRIPEFSNLAIASDTKYAGYVHHITFKNFIPTIRSGVNDQFRYTINGTAYLSILQEGHYDATRLAGALQSSLQANGSAGFLVSYDLNTRCLQFTIPASYTLVFTRTSTVWTDDRYDFQNATDRFLDTAGLMGNVNVSYTNTTIQANYPLNLYGPISAVFYFSAGINNNCISNFPGDPSIIASVPITAEYGEVEVFEPGLPIVFTLSASDFAYMSINCMDEKGTLISPPPNTDLSIHIMLIPLQTS